ncbi:hypothetical protein MAR_027678 [Mya arenaria]|uniref:Uncharacterized protein n=1 Tax=Mya arenaria TaxID=6604 RepID=A0ABY7EU77_MYAAR|nr:hypothetical protein MAR_027678 [Mya arenaria]
MKKQAQPVHKDTSITKCNVLKVVASLFDPLGLFSSVSLCGKSTRSIWYKNVEWGEIITDDRHESVLHIHAICLLTRCLFKGIHDSLSYEAFEHTFSAVI